ncbi:MAG TPA: hypothetical protein DIT03_07680 [Candidatus Accumulibacter sp.]|nr:hypothetical protein [Accumulibacter sp.]
MKVFTIGFTRKTAEQFFGLLDRPDLKRVLDIRLNNTSQLAGFTRSADLRFFLRRVIGKDYVHLPQLAPTADMLKTYRDGNADWAAYERDFLALISERRVEETVSAELLDGGCLLCSEATPEKCHRRLVVEYLAQRRQDLIIQHLL